MEAQARGPRFLFFFVARSGLIAISSASNRTSKTILGAEKYDILRRESEPMVSIVRHASLSGALAHDRFCS